MKRLVAVVIVGSAVGLAACGGSADAGARQSFARFVTSYNASTLQLRSAAANASSLGAFHRAATTYYGRLLKLETLLGNTSWPSSASGDAKQLTVELGKLAGEVLQAETANNSNGPNVANAMLEDASVLRSQAHVVGTDLGVKVGN